VPTEGVLTVPLSQIKASSYSQRADCDEVVVADANGAESPEIPCGLLGSDQM